MPKVRSNSPPIIPDHEVLSWVGGGSYGDVWLCRNIFGQHRAVKIVHRDTFGTETPFIREFSGIQQFEPVSRTHPGLVHVLQVGRDELNESFYYIMELADHRHGEISRDPAGYQPTTLESILRHRGRLPVHEVVDLAAKLAAALGHLHRYGLIHRDIKPGNIIFVNSEPKLADIGLVTDPAMAKSFVGTEGFVPPEGPYTPAADIYSLGKVLYEAATGNDRFAYPEPALTVPETELRDLQELFEIIFRACETDPKLRYRSADEMLADLHLLQAGGSVRKLHSSARRNRAVLRAFAVTAVVALVAGGALYYERRHAARLRQLVDEKRETLVRFQVTSGAKEADAGDPFRALPFYVEAMRLDAPSEGADEAHRRRIASILRHSPRLLAFGEVSGAIHAAAWSPDNARLALGTSRGVEIWNVETMVRDFALDPAVHATAIDFSKTNALEMVHPDGDLSTWTLQPDTGLPNLGRLGLNSRSTLLLSNAALTLRSNHTLRLFNLTSGHAINPAISNREPISAFAANTSGALIAAVTSNNVLRAWASDTGALLLEVQVPGDPVSKLVVSPNGAFVAAANGEYLRLWSTHSRKLVADPVRNFGQITEIAFNSGSDLLLTCAVNFNGDGLLRIWSVGRSGQIADPFMTVRGVHSAAFSPDPRRIAATTQDGRACLYDMPSRNVSSAFLHTGQDDSRAAFSPDGRRLLLWSPRGRWCVWDFATDGFSYPLMSHQDPLRRVKFTRDQQFALTASTTGEIGVWKLADGSFGKLPHEGQPVTVRFSADGRWAVKFNEAECLLIPTTSIHAGTPDLHRLPGGFVAFGEDARHLSIVSGPGDQLTVYRLHGRPEPLYTRSLPFRPRSLHWDPGNGETTIAAILGGKPVVEVHGTNGVVLSKTIDHQGPFQQIALRFQAQWLFTVSSDLRDGLKSCRLWRRSDTFSTPVEIKHREEIVDLTANKERTRFATGHSDGTVRVWDSISGRLVGNPIRHSKVIMGLRFSPDGRFIASASADATVRLWDAATGEPLSRPMQHSGGLNDLAFSRDGRLIITGGWERTARIWDVTPISGSLEDIAALCEILSGEAFSSRSPSASKTPLLATFRKLRSSIYAPGNFREVAENWHRRSFLVARQVDDWPTMIFHLEQLQKISPDSTEIEILLQRTIGRARANTGAG